MKTNQIKEVQQEFDDLVLTEENRYVQFEYSYCGENRKVIAKIDSDKKYWTLIWIHENIDKGNTRCFIMREECVPLAWKHSSIIQGSYWKEQYAFVKNLTA